MASKTSLVARVRSHLLDAASERYLSPDIEAALLAEARALFASEDVPSDMIGSMQTEADPVAIGDDGTFDAPADSLRICAGYVDATRVTRVVMREGLGKQTDHSRISTVGDPSIFREGQKTYLLPPLAFSGKKISILYVKEDVSLESIPPAFEDCLTLGAASRLAADFQEERLSAILENRARTHLLRVVGAKK